MASIQRHTFTACAEPHGAARLRCFECCYCFCLLRRSESSASHVSSSRSLVRFRRHPERQNVARRTSAAGSDSVGVRDGGSSCSVTGSPPARTLRIELKSVEEALAKQTCSCTALVDSRRDMRPPDSTRPQKDQSKSFASRLVDLRYNAWGVRVGFSCADGQERHADGLLAEDLHAEPPEERLQAEPRGARNESRSAVGRGSFASDAPGRIRRGGCGAEETGVVG